MESNNEWVEVTEDEAKASLQPADEWEEVTEEEAEAGIKDEWEDVSVEDAEKEKTKVKKKKKGVINLSFIKNLIFVNLKKRVIDLLPYRKNFPFFYS